MPDDAATFLRSRIRAVLDWPRAGVVFRDITPLLQDRKSLRILVDLFVQHFIDQEFDLVAGIDARGFILGSVIAYELNRGFIPVRKRGKLPFETVAEEYALEYGTAAVELHTDAVRAGERILLMDDLVATGGTMLAAIRLLSRLGAHIVGAAAIIDLPDLNGSRLLRAEGFELFAPCTFGGT